MSVSPKGDSAPNICKERLAWQGHAVVSFSSQLLFAFFPLYAYEKHDNDDRKWTDCGFRRTQAASIQCRSVKYFALPSSSEVAGLAID